MDADASDVEHWATSERGLGEVGGERVLVPVVDRRASEWAVEVGAGLAERRDAELLVVRRDDGSGPTPPRVPDDRTEPDGSLGDLTPDGRESPSVPVTAVSPAGRRASSVVTSAATDHDVDTVVVGRPDGPGARHFRPSKADRLAARADCDVVVVNGEPPLGTVSSVLLAVSGGPHSHLAASVARDVAAGQNAWVDVVHVVPPEAGKWRRARGWRAVRMAKNRLGDHDEADVWLHEADDVVDALVEQSAYYDLTVMGAPRKSRLRRFVSGSTVRAVRRGSANAVVTVHRAGEGGSRLAGFVG